MQTNIGLFLKKRADICPRREAFVEFERGRRFTFAEVNTRCNRVANGLLAAGIKPGDRVATLLKNSIEFIETYFAVAKIGAVMVPVNLVSVAATLAVLLWFFRRDIPQVYDPADLEEPASAIHDRATFRAGWWVLGILLIGCFALEPLGIPISAISAVCAVLLLVIAAKGHKISTRKVLKDAPWQIVVFSLGMYLVVYGLRNAGLTTYLATWLDTFATYGVWGAAMGTGVLTALLSSAMNNLPTVLIGALSIESSHAVGVIKDAMIYANVIGSDLGPKITPIGSLATLLWLHILARKGITITWGYYFKVGIVLTLPVLLITLAALALRLSI